LTNPIVASEGEAGIPTLGNKPHKTPITLSNPIPAIFSLTGGSDNSDNKRKTEEKRFKEN